jgi:hypothetical protein
LSGVVSASAHTTGFSGIASCDHASGSYSVLWSGHTDYVPHGDTAAVTTSAYSPAESSVPDTVTTSVAPNADYSFTQTAIPGTATAASVSVHLTWTGPSRFAADASNSVQLTGDCYAVVTPAEPSVSTPNCIDTTLTVTLPKTTGVTYNASGPLKLAPGESVTITPIRLATPSTSPSAR